MTHATSPNQGESTMPEQGSRSLAGLLDEVRSLMQTRHYSRGTIRSYCHWIQKFVRFHASRQPRELGEQEINRFLTHLAVEERSAPPRRIRP